MIAWLASPPEVTLAIAAPDGGMVATHLVVDGRAEARVDAAPVTYRFRANELRFAVICLDEAPPAEVTVEVRGRAGGVLTSAGVKGRFTSGWRGGASEMEAMTETHVTSMRRSVQAEAGISAP